MPRRTPLAALAGAVSAGLALGVGELVSALGSRGQSLVGSVAGEVVDRTPGSVIHAAIEALGTSDKPVLLSIIVVVCVGLGAVAGILGLRHRWLITVMFLGAALLGVLTGLRDPLTSRWVVVLAALGAAATGIVVLHVLLSRLPADATAIDAPADAEGVAATPVPIPGRGTGSRRAFFALSGTVGLGAVALAIGGRALSDRSRTVAGGGARTPRPPLPEVAPSAVAPTDLAVEGLSPLITPTSQFYRIDTAFTFPSVDLDRWRLRIDGLVDRPLEYSYAELLALPQVEVPITIACVSNEVGGSLVGTAFWQGVPLGALLETAGVQPEGTQILGRSLDGFTAGFPTAAALDGRTALVAVGMNGEPLPIRHGFPARLIVEGLYGYVSATKWLRSIELCDWERVNGYWVPLGWSKEGPIKLQSRIDVPRAGDTVRAGMTPIAGVAWAPGVGVAAVEVQVDGGDWIPAELGPEFTDATWRQWMLPWEATAGRHTLRVRAISRDGEVQTAEVAPVEPNGATGHHTRQVTVRA
ncbi:MAG: molybdopterin-dependent oxidoreductase [Acidobacteria bacterium]|nr:molybdopterin-dependent oxidoreductase [Acidobacteriota bacterium]